MSVYWEPLPRDWGIEPRPEAFPINSRAGEIQAPLPGEVSIVWRASIAALLGERAEAMRLLIEAFGRQGTMEMHGNSDFDGMKDYPPFREFIRPKG